LRFDDGVTERVAGMGDEAGSKGDKTRFDALPPIGIILNLVGVGAIGSDGDTVLAGNSSDNFKCVCSCSTDIMRNALNLFKFKVHI
jgi:hypothetical protein